MTKVLRSCCTLFVLGIFAAPAAAQGFGSAVAVGDAEVFVAEPLNEMDPGAVYVYRKAATGVWQSVVQLVGSDAADGDRFGRAIASDDNLLVVGATNVNDTKGAVYVFQKNASGNWTQAARLVAPDGVAGDAFGRSVAIHGNVMVVSSWAHGDGAGAVYVFERGTNGSWVQRDKLMVDSETGSPFGQVLAIDGTRILIGAPVQFGFRRGPQAGGDDRRGHVYVFVKNAAGSWQQEGQLEQADLPRGAGFGAALAVTGDHAYVGAPGINSGAGTVFVFTRDPETGNWGVRGSLQPFDASLRAQFGAAIEANGSETWVGAPGADGSGKTYVFTRSPNGGWAGAMKVAGGDDLEERDRFASTLAVLGNVAVAGVAGDDFGAGTAVILERENGTWMAKQKVAGDVKGPVAVTNGQVDCTQGVAVAFNCNEVDMVAFLPIKDLGGPRGVRLNDLWGWTDAETGREYAIVGRLDGTSFVDISNPNSPRYLGNLPKTEAARASTWRDMKVYRDHVFIVADGAGPHGLQVFDLKQLRNVSNPVTFRETAHYDQIASAHNIVINEETGYAFAVGSSAGGETCGGGLHMINIQDPTKPSFAGCFADPNTGRRGTGYSHDAQCVTYHGPDVEHAGREICLGANETALSIADVTDKEQPVALSMASYPNVGYTHQGWLTEDQRYFYMNDELDELGGNVVGTRTLVWDVSDLDDPVLVKEHMSTNLASDHNLYVTGDYMYQSNYQSGLRVLDVRDPENPVEVGFFDTVPYGEDTPGFGGSWSNYPFFASGVIIVTSGQEGLFLLKKRPQGIIP